jgi:hypothetical protein
MKISDKFLFKTTLSSKLHFDDLKTIYKHNIGRDYIKGYIGKDYLSLYYIGKSPVALGISRKSIKLDVIPNMRFTIDKDDFENEKQTIIFRATLFFLLGYFLLLVFAIIMVVLAVLLKSGIHAGFGFAIIVLGYKGMSLYYKFQLKQFEDDLKIFTKYYLEKTSR